MFGVVIVLISLKVKLVEIKILIPLIDSFVGISILLYTIQVQDDSRLFFVLSVVYTSTARLQKKLF